MTAGEWSRKLGSISQRPMRIAALSQRISTEAPSTFVEQAGMWLKHGPIDIPTTLALDSLVGVLIGKSLEYQTVASLYAAAKEAAMEPLARLFFSFPQGDPEATEKQLDPERQVVPRGRTMTLGERKSLARLGRRDLLMHIKRDPHPAVVEVLLENPNLQLLDIVAIAAKRPILGEALSIIAKSHKWFPQHKIRRAIALNPFAPIDVSLPITCLLRTQDLREIAHDEKLPPVLTLQCRQLLTLRGQTSS